MPKRSRDADDEVRHERPLAKRNRTLGRNCFDDLSDELVLRTLSFLPVSDIVNVERVCARFQRLGGDNEIWREKFYNRFVRPRARRIPGLGILGEKESRTKALHYASKSAKWLEHSSRANVDGGWKRRYKVKLNWSKGRCRSHEMALDCPIKPRILVKMCSGRIITTNDKGLRSYSQRVRPQLLSTHYWEDNVHRNPTSLAVDTKSDRTIVAVGFSTGAYEIYTLESNGSFVHECTHCLARGNTVTSLAVSWPYILTMSDNQEMALYEVHDDTSIPEWNVTALATLHSDAALSPVSLSLRRTPTTLVASIAYSFSRLNAGWCLGLQEIRLSLAGAVVDSRLTSTVDTPLRDFPLRADSRLSSRSASTGPLPLHPQIMHPPNSLSHSGCYLLAGLPDNTLMVYTIISSPDKFEINAGRRLWGHTSSVSGAEVSDRGKALSVSARGDEIRVWELEEILSSYSLHTASTQLKPWPNKETIETALAKRGNGLGIALKEIKEESVWTRHWVGFDDEQVVVLGERDQRQILSCYDFA